jgi:putative sterol carrier protein
MRVRDGVCTAEPGGDAKADMVMTQSTDSFMKMFLGMQNPMLALLTRKIRVKGLMRMGRFAKLFPDKNAEFHWEPGAAPSQAS